MTERIPMADDIRQALRHDGWTFDEADEGIERIKKRGIGHLAAQENMQASIGAAFREAKAEAWDEGNRWGFERHCNDQENCWDETELVGLNPYRDEAGL